MTRDEAVKMLQATRLMLMDGANQPISDLYYALDMAIEALEQTEPQTCDDCIWNVCNYNKVDWERKDTEIAKAIVHKMIDDAVIAEDAYPDLRQKMHDAVDEYEPQTERSE